MASSSKKRKTDEMEESGGESSTEKIDAPVSWLQCIICQAHSSEKLQYPATLKCTDLPHSAGYKLIAQHILEFHRLGALPFSMHIAQLNTQEGLEANLIANSACWHKSCRNKISKLKLDGLRGREDSISSSPVKTRKSSGVGSSQLKEKCLFCDGSGKGDPHLVSTLNLSKKLINAATQ
jgi:hypothetical protein